jgi:filamentous hemagglutinin family protein
VKFASNGDKTAGGKVIEDAKVILATVPSAKAMSTVLGSLSVNGKLIIVGASGQPCHLFQIGLHYGIIIPAIEQMSI